MSASLADAAGYYYTSLLWIMVIEDVCCTETSSLIACSLDGRHRGDARWAESVMQPIGVVHRKGMFPSLLIPPSPDCEGGNSILNASPDARGRRKSHGSRSTRRHR